MGTKTFDALVNTSRRPRECPRCAGPTDMAVAFEVRHIDPQTRMHGKRVFSVSRNMCESCAVETYEMVMEAWALAVGS